MSDEQAPKKWLTEGVALAAVPVLGHLLAFWYEFGYARYWGIPLMFIRVTLTSILLALGTILFFALLEFAWAEWLYRRWIHKFDKTHIVKLAILKCTYYLLPLPPVVLLLGFKNWREWLPTLLLIICFIVWRFVDPLFTQRDKKTYAEKLIAQNESRRQTPSLLDAFDKAYIKSVGNVVFFIVLASMVSYAAGRGAAMHQETFLVVDRPPSPIIVLRIYGEVMICAPFERTTKTVSPKLILLKFAEDPTMDFALEEVGPLSSPRYSPLDLDKIY